jgi:hypothetical protein
MVANLGGCYFTDKLEVLGNTGNHSARKYTAIVTDSRAIQYHGMRENMAIISYDYIFFNHSKRVYHYILPDLSLGVDNS